MAHNRWQQARAGASLAQTSFERVQRLYDDGVVPAQRRDEVEAQLKMARELEAMAKAGYDMAQNGAREEDKEAAAALVDQAAGAVSEVESLLEEARVRAPIDGEVSQHVVEAGELASAGMPLATIVNLEDTWAVFDVREDHLGGMRIGERIAGRVPAMEDAPLELEVTYIAALGDFAALARHQRLGRLRSQNLRGARQAGAAHRGPAARHERRRALEPLSGGRE